MNSSPRIAVESLAAFDVHVHLESADDRTATDTAAKKYFGDSGAARDANALAEYYRSRKIAFVIFAVDERLTGRAHVSNDEVVQFAEQNSDVAIPFASIDPNRGAEGVQEAKGAQWAGYRDARWRRRAPEVRAPHAHRRRGRGLSFNAHHHGPPFVSLAGRGNFDLSSQAQRLHRPFRLVAKVFLADTHSVRKHSLEEQGSLRIRLSVDHAGPLAGRLREDRHPGRSAAPNS